MSSNMEYLGHTQSSVYMLGPQLHTGESRNNSSRFLPSVYGLRSPNSQYGTPSPGTIQRSMTTLNSWKPSQSGSVADYRTSFNIPDTAGAFGSRPDTAGAVGSRMMPFDRWPATYGQHPDWMAYSRTELTASDRSRAASELVRADLLTLCHDACDRTRRSQNDATRRLADRVNDTKFWRDEIRAEADAATAEVAALDKAAACLERALAETAEPLHIAEECLRLREQRIGVDLIHDDVEKELLKEIDIIRQCQREMSDVLKDAKNQASINKSSEAELARASAEKNVALGLDKTCQKMRNTSRGLQFYDGIENFDSTVSNQETWTEYSSDLVARSQRDRAAAKSYRTLIEQTLAKTAEAMTNQWNIVNAAFADRIREYIKARTDIEVHLSKVLQEIVELEKYRELLKRCIREKAAPLKLAQTRLATRVPRPNMESCKDSAQFKLAEEVREIGNTVEELEAKLRDVDRALEQLQITRTTLEQDLAVKNNSLHVDRELCLGWRKSFDMAPRRAVCSC